jgi:uncharacterized protein with HEPN domain
MRHRLVHGYGAITDAIVYNTVLEDLPVLIENVKMILARNMREID